MNLSECHEKSIAVVLLINEREQVVQGRGQYAHDPLLGAALRIELGPDEGAGQPALILSEATWTGEISRGDRYGCDLCIHLQM